MNTSAPRDRVKTFDPRALQGAGLSSQPFCELGTFTLVPKD